VPLPGTIADYLQEHSNELAWTTYPPYPVRAAHFLVVATALLPGKPRSGLKDAGRMRLVRCERRQLCRGILTQLKGSPGHHIHEPPLRHVFIVLPIRLAQLVGHEPPIGRNLRRADRLQAQLSSNVGVCVACSSSSPGGNRASKQRDADFIVAPSRVETNVRFYAHLDRRGAGGLPRKGDFRCDT